MRFWVIECVGKMHILEGMVRVKEFVDSLTNYLFVLENAQNGGKYYGFFYKNAAW